METFKKVYIYDSNKGSEEISFLVAVALVGTGKYCIGSITKDEDNKEEIIRICRIFQGVFKW